MRRTIASVLAVAVVVGVRMGAPAGAQLIPLIAIEQGVSPHLIGGVPVLISRTGSQVAAFSPLTPGADGDRVVYCPRENIYVSPVRADLFNADGEFVAGKAPRDLDRFPVTVTDDLEVLVDVSAPIVAKGRSKGTVPGEIGNIYYDWRANPSKPAAFCRDPIRA
jgi:hypothetical protein